MQYVITTLFFINFATIAYLYFLTKCFKTIGALGIELHNHTKNHADLIQNHTDFLKSIKIMIDALDDQILFLKKHIDEQKK